MQITVMVCGTINDKTHLISKRKVMLTENGTLRGHVQWKLENFVSNNKRLKTRKCAN